MRGYFFCFSFLLFVGKIAGEWKVSEKEAIALLELRPMVEKYLTQDYMKDDKYLLPFLRSKHLNIGEARSAIIKTMEWRKTNNIDNILNEKLDVERELPYSLEGLDYEGSPLIIIRAGQWDARRLVIAGKVNQAKRVVHKIFELASKKLRESESLLKKNITQGNAIADLSGFTIRKHACVQCIPVYLEIIIVFDSYYPQIAKNLIAVNTPRVFQSLLEILLPATSEYTRSVIKIFGYDRDEWSKFLLKRIPEDQLPKYLGGTKD